MPFCHARLRACKPPPKGYPVDPKTPGEHLRRRRLDRRQTLKQAAAEIGVRLDALWHWEHNGRFPYPKALPAIERYLGYALAPAVAELGARLRAWRATEGISLVKAGERLGLDSHTLSDLEHGREVTLPVRMAVDAAISSCR